MTTQDGNIPITTSTQDMSDRLPAASPIIAQKPTSFKPDLSRIADYLADDYEIGFVRDRPPKHRRYATLRTQAIFNVLTEIYGRLFKQNWEFLRRSIDGFTTAEGIRDRQWEHAARAYISCWFYDLYVSVRDATEKVSGSAFTQYYHTPAAHILHEYDAFLTHLNAIIRPTHIKMALEDVIYIPRVSTTMDIASENPFGLDATTWKLDSDFAYSIIDRMKATNSKWRVEPLVSDTLGRPGWLFDWHQDGNTNKAFAWFPAEGNYSLEDMVAPHIIGEAITPCIGPRDVDDWQYFPNLIKPANVAWERARRVIERRFRGSAEFRTYEEAKIDLARFTTAGHALTSAKRSRPSTKTSSSKSSGDGTGEEPSETVTDIQLPKELSAEQMKTLIETFEVDRFRIIDWTYLCCIISRNTSQKRDGALRSFCFKQ
ncbi:MAG: coat protein [Plant associated deltapartitivirus 6]|nr:MAG: coat protein [Plant associated deltapartitivirus 6]